MWKTKKILALTLSFTSAISLTSCSAESEDVLVDSLLISDELSYKTTVASIGDYETTVSKNLSIRYANDRTFNFDSDGYFSEFFVSSGDYVLKGDLIASYTTGGSVVPLETKKLELERLESEYDRSVETYQSNYTANKTILNNLDSDSYDYEIQKLNMEQLAISHEQYKYNTQRSIDSLEESIAELEAELETQYLYADYDGEISNLATVDNGDKISTDTAAYKLTSTEDILIYVDDPTGLSWGQTVQIEVGVGDNITYLSGKVISLSSILSADVSDASCYIQIDYDASDVDFSDFNFPNFNVKLVATTEYMPDVLLLEDRAINQDGTSYYVNILEDGVIKKRYVLSDYHNSDYYWIEEGLSDGQTVVID
ncbi:MAG: efflux RND transporter periplasmic adaptor subunit [Clostridia bacterium]